MEKKETIKLRHKVIKELIAAHEIEDQQRLIDLIKGHYGIESSQAAISRDLRALGVSKRKIKDKMIYEIADVDASKEILRLAIVDIMHNESFIIVHTLPGLADFVGDFLDLQSDHLSILGTIAGENTIFVAPQSMKNIKITYDAICLLLYVKK